jgi:hypothetical protein
MIRSLLKQQLSYQLENQKVDVLPLLAIIKMDVSFTLYLLNYF